MSGVQSSGTLHALLKSHGFRYKSIEIHEMMRIHEMAKEMVSAGTFQENMIKVAILFESSDLKLA